MNVIGLFVLIFVLCGVFVGVYAIAGHANTTPVDSYGTTVGEDTNNTAGNASAIMQSGSAVIPWIVVLLAILVIVAVFFWAVGQYGHGGGSVGRGL
jgi:Fe2+ transport system protein B